MFTCCLVPSGSPNELTAVAFSSTVIRISWTEVEPIDQNGVIIQYEVMYSSSGLKESNFTNGSLFTTEITRLEENVEYNISVRAYTSVGPGPFSIIVMKTTGEDG